MMRGGKSAIRFAAILGAEQVFHRRLARVASRCAGAEISTLGAAAFCGRQAGAFEGQGEAPEFCGHQPAGVALALQQARGAALVVADTAASDQCDVVYIHPRHGVFQRSHGFDLLVAMRCGGGATPAASCDFPGAFMPGNTMCGGLLERATTYSQKSRFVRSESISADAGAGMRPAGYLGVMICDPRGVASSLLARAGGGPECEAPGRPSGSGAGRRMRGGRNATSAGLRAGAPSVSDLLTCAGVSAPAAFRGVV